MLLYIRFLDLNSFCIMETFCLIISYIRFLLPLWPFFILFCLFLLSSQTASLSDCAPCLGDLIELQEFQYHMGADASSKHTFTLNVSPEFRLMSTSLFHLMSDVNLQLSLFQNWAPDFLFLVSYFSSITGNLQSHPQPGTSEASMIPLSDILCSMHQEILSAPSSKYVSIWPLLFSSLGLTLVQATILFLLGHWVFFFFFCHWVLY